MQNLETIIKQILEEQVSPELALHGGSVSFISVDAAGEIVKVSFNGACKTCPSAQMTLENIVTEQLRKAVPNLKEVILVNETHQDMLDFAKQLMKKA